MVKLSDQIKETEILLLGDFMLDRYTLGKSTRISPEAPVPILNVENVFSLPGGAGNVALNLKMFKVKVTAIGRIGDDQEGNILIEDLCKQGIETTHFIVQKGHKTIVKDRYISNSQQLLRVDREEIGFLNECEEQRLIKNLPNLIEDKKLIVISDYGKGFLSDRLISEVIKLGKKKGKSVLVDPKGKNFKKYKNATIIKPNLQEAYEATNFDIQTSLKEVVKELFLQTNAEIFLITKSEKGMTLFKKNGYEKDFQVQVHKVRDVTGAGDTVLAVFAACLANNINIEKAIEISNIATELAIQQLGCAKIELRDIEEKLNY